MNRILIIAHAPLAHALRQCALHVFPDCEADLAELDVQPNMPPEESLGAARIVLAQLTADPICGPDDLLRVAVDGGVADDGGAHDEVDGVFGDDLDAHEKPPCI